MNGLPRSSPDSAFWDTVLHVDTNSPFSVFISLVGLWKLQSLCEKIEIEQVFTIWLASGGPSSQRLQLSWQAASLYKGPLYVTFWSAHANISPDFEVSVLVILWYAMI